MCRGRVTVLGCPDQSPQRVVEDRSAVFSPARGPRVQDQGATGLGFPGGSPEGSFQPRAPRVPWLEAPSSHGLLSPGLLFQGRLSRGLFPSDGGTSAGGPSLHDGCRPCAYGPGGAPGGEGTASGLQPHRSCFSSPRLAPPPGPAPARSLCVLWVWRRQEFCKQGRCAQGHPRRAVTTEQGALLGPAPQAGENPAWMFTGGARLPTAAPTHRKAAPQTTRAAGRYLPGPAAAAWASAVEITRRPRSRDDPEPRGDTGGQGPGEAAGGANSQLRAERTLGSDLSLFYRSSQMRRR